MLRRPLLRPRFRDAMLHPRLTGPAVTLYPGSTTAEPGRKAAVCRPQASALAGGGEEET